MSKLQEWLVGGLTFISIWLAVLLGYDLNTLDAKMKFVMLWFPLLVLSVFGIYATIVVLYKVLTFHDCKEAASELREQIKEAKTELLSKGISLKTK